MTIREILKKARNIYYVTIHKNGGSKYMSLDELMSLYEKKFKD